MQNDNSNNQNNNSNNNNNNNNNNIMRSGGPYKQFVYWVIRCIFMYSDGHICTRNPYGRCRLLRRYASHRIVFCRRGTQTIGSVRTDLLRTLTAIALALLLGCDILLFCPLSCLLCGSQRSPSAMARGDGCHCRWCARSEFKKQYEN